ncbi:single-stranded DNA-binding protein [Streptomyces sp. NPDC048612]|uniref:single-stranded DNA-binding protein n=1 Tax=Streptomyces sp. NPDC048612 TaxID=3365579 RepID=UPI0037228D13
MNDTMVTLVGNAATAVEHRLTAAGVTVARFRLAATSRRWDKAQERWTDGETSFYTVRSWRGLADNVAASVAVGEPLIVQGRLRLREGEQPPEKGGQRWFSAEVDAVAVGHDLTRGTAAFRRVLRSASRTGAGAGVGAAVEGAPVAAQQPAPAAGPSSAAQASTASRASAVPQFFSAPVGGGAPQPSPASGSSAAPLSPSAATESSPVPESHPSADSSSPPRPPRRTPSTQQDLWESPLPEAGPRTSADDGPAEAKSAAGTPKTAKARSASGAKPVSGARQAAAGERAGRKDQPPNEAAATARAGMGT